MEDVDFAKSWLALKAYIGTKRGHGQDDLLAEMSRLEIESSEAHSGTPVERHDKQHRRTRRRSLPEPDASASRTGKPDDHQPTTPEGARNNGNRAEHAGTR